LNNDTDLEGKAAEVALLRTAGLGMDIEAFLGGPVGTYLIRRSEDEIKEAVSDLCRADPDDAKGIRDLQNRIWRAEAFQQWLAEGVQEGYQAAKIYETGEG
jgi:hypothetical protein